MGSSSDFPYSDCFGASPLVVVLEDDADSEGAAAPSVVGAAGAAASVTGAAAATSGAFGDDDFGDDFDDAFGEGMPGLNAETADIISTTAANHSRATQGILLCTCVIVSCRLGICI